MKKVVLEASIEISENQLDDIIEQVSYFGNQKISYTEFLAATLETRNDLNGEILSEIFHQFDTD